MKHWRSSATPLPIILGGQVNGLGLVRGLGEAGIPSIVIDYRANMAAKSKYVLAGLQCPHPDEAMDAFVQYMAELGSELGTKGVLFCTNDIWLIPISKHQHELEAYYHYPMSKWDVIGQCTDKQYLYGLAAEAGVPFPQTVVLQGIRDVEAHKTHIPFPWVIKPAITVGFLEKLGSRGRTLIVKNENDLAYWQQRIVTCGLESVPLVLQESIPGGAEALYTLTAYSDPNGEILGYSTGHKIRQNPPDAGTIISGRVTPTPEIFHLGQRLIKHVGFYGISNTEFKKDARDGAFKLIEINPRPGMWNYATTATGINLPLMAYRQAIGEPVKPVEPVDTELIWLYSYLDFALSVYGFRKKGHVQYALSLRQWLASIRGKRVDAVFQKRDPIPGIYDLVTVLTTVLSARARSAKAYRSSFV